MICHFSTPFCFSQLNFIVLFQFPIKSYHILFIIIVFRLGCDKRLLFLQLCFPRDQSLDVTPRLGEGG